MMQCKQWKWCALVGYIVVRLIVLAVILQICSKPGFTILSYIEYEGGAHVITAIILFTAASLCFEYLQGSNPGYLSESLLQDTNVPNTEKVKAIPLNSISTLCDEDLEYGEGHIDLDSTRSKPQIKFGGDNQCSPEGKISALAESTRGSSIQHSPLAVDFEEDTLLPYDSSNPYFCNQCQLYPPLRSHHCRVCGKCVAKFDHHCFVLGTCVGEKNHYRFWWFLFFQTAEIFFAIYLTQSSFRYRTLDETWLQVNCWRLALSMILLALLALTAGLLGFHTFLAMGNVTTFEFGHSGNENNKFTYLNGFKECDLPFSRGLRENLKIFCCRDRLGHEWQPIKWSLPSDFDRNSDNIWENIWENRYYSCC